MRTIASTSLKILITALLAGFLNVSHAEVLVLIHGYMGSPASWERSGVNELLEQSGWKRAGILIAGTGEYLPDPINGHPQGKAENVSYMVDLPWMRTLEEQADFLDEAILAVAKMHPDEKITLAGHSAGGLVARVWLVEHFNAAVDRLITIATPNLGTVRAIDALDATDSIFPPIDMVRDIFGGKLYRTARHSRPLLYEFTPPGEFNPNILYWLNQQPHPDIEYISIVREDARGVDRDWLVSADSQDLNNVPALRGKAKSYSVARKHSLNPQDGYLLASILSHDEQLPAR